MCVNVFVCDLLVNFVIDVVLNFVLLIDVVMLIDVGC